MGNLQENKQDISINEKISIPRILLVRVRVSVWVWLDSIIRNIKNRTFLKVLNTEAQYKRDLATPAMDTKIRILVLHVETRA